jgi:hypothetical protein
MEIFKMLLNVVTAGTKVLVSGKKFVYASVEAVYCL